MPVASCLRQAFDDQFVFFNGSASGGTSTPLVPGTGTGWQTRLPFGGMAARCLYPLGDKAYYGDATTGVNNFSVVNGVLQCAATAATTSGAGSNPFSAAGGATNPDTGTALQLTYNSCAMSSVASFNMLYGYFSVTAKLPPGKGLWPGVWLKPAAEAYYVGGLEIDILESFEHTQTVLYTSSHRDGSSKTELMSVGNNVGDMTSAFHEYGVDWTPTELIFYFDGAEIRRFVCPADFNVPAIFMMNFQIGGSALDYQPDGTSIPAVLQFDRFEAWTTRYTRSVGGNLAKFQLSSGAEFAAGFPTPALRCIFAEEYNGTFDRGTMQGVGWNTQKSYSAPNDRTIVNNHEGEFYADDTTNWSDGTPTFDPYVLSHKAGQSVLRLASATFPGGKTLPAPYNTISPALRVQAANKTTLGMLAFLYGNIEICARMTPKAAGLWPAFWMMGANNRSLWEWDWIEIFGTNLQGGAVIPYIAVSAHTRPTGTNDTATSLRNNTSTLLKADGVTAAGLVPQDGAFHVYNYSWGPNYVAAFMDGQLDCVMGNIGMATTPGYLLVNQAYANAGSFVDTWDGATMAEYDIDYIRVYATKDTQTIAGLGALKSGLIQPAF